MSDRSGSECTGTSTDEACSEIKSTTLWRANRFTDFARAAKVNNLDLALLWRLKKNVLGLEVAVNDRDFGRAEIVQCFQQLLAEPPNQIQ